MAEFVADAAADCGVKLAAAAAATAAAATNGDQLFAFAAVVEAAVEVGVVEVGVDVIVCFLSFLLRLLDELLRFSLLILLLIKCLGGLVGDKSRCLNSMFSEGLAFGVVVDDDDKHDFLCLFRAAWVLKLFPQQLLHLKLVCWRAA
jgi:hypothetical protein